MPVVPAACSVESLQRAARAMPMYNKFEEKLVELCKCVLVFLAKAIVSVVDCYMSCSRAPHNPSCLPTYANTSRGNPSAMA